MNKIGWFLIILVVLVAAIWIGPSYIFKAGDSDQSALKVKTFNMKLSSSAFENNQTIPLKYTCDGEDINPELLISDTPKEAKSLVLIVDDPDAPVKTWVHWVVYNISPETTIIQENSVPKGAIQIENDFGRENYGGPCPPLGTHRYFFKIFALDTKLNLPANLKLEDLNSAMENHILDSAQLIGLYQRKK